jgi:hypothetical protein
MSERTMSILLIVFTAIFLFIILGWGMFKSLIGLNNPHYSLARSKYDRLTGIHIYYRVILVLFIIVSSAYFLIPESKAYFLPIEWLNNDYINVLGFVILLFAFIRIIIFQAKLDKSLHLYYFNSSDQANSELVPKTERNLLKSILFVYLGMFVVVSTIATFILLLISIMIYYKRSSNRNYKIKTPMPS